MTTEEIQRQVMRIVLGVMSISLERQAGNSPFAVLGALLT
jgi:hypothetical protein